MNPEQKVIARVLFKLKVYEANGKAYEDLFVRVMEASHKDFRKIKPHGSDGDRKNDGYIPSSGSYFQVFAPEDLSQTVSKAVAKLKEDFQGLKIYWDTIHKIRSWYFAHNDKYSGTYPGIEKALNEIMTAHSLEACESFRSKHLEDLLFTQSDEAILSIAGFLPSPESVELLDYAVLNEVIQHVARYAGQVDLSQILSVPDFGDKIRFNGLNPAVGGLLTQGSFHVGTLAKYFESNSNFAKQAVRDTLHQLYLNISSKDFSGVDGGVSKSDLVFFDLLQTITPGPSQAAQNAALVVMAYFFESCDVFEDPRSANASA
jgi:hypothetical protein